eukprot:3928117-Pleurochrysis_carterae.AAC.1
MHQTRTEPYRASGSCFYAVWMQTSVCWLEAATLQLPLIPPSLPKSNTQSQLFNCLRAGEWATQRLITSDEHLPNGCVSVCNSLNRARS